MGETIRERRLLLVAAVVIVTTICVWATSRRPKLPGSLGAMAADIRVGMSRDEALAVLRAHYTHADRTSLRLSGETCDGRKLSGYWDAALEKLPPAHEIAWVEITADDDDCRDLIVTLGRNGVVTAVRLESRSVWEELRYGLARDTGWSGGRSLFRDRGQCFESIVRNFFEPD